MQSFQEPGTKNNQSNQVKNLEEIARFLQINQQVASLNAERIHRYIDTPYIGT